MLDFRLLGRFEVVTDGAPIVLRPKQQALLALLLVRRGEAVSAEWLIENLWPTPPPAARASLQNCISQLRKSLGRDVVVRRSDGYGLAVEAEQTDLGRFERLVAEGRAAEGAAERSAKLREGLAVWRGSALAGVSAGAAADFEAARLEDLRVEALEDAVEAELELGRSAELVPELEQLIVQAPFRERPRAQLMLALYRSGRQSDALEAFQRTRETLTEELGLEPSAALCELERAILNQDPALDRPQTVPLPIGERRRLGTVLFADRLRHFDRWPLVGRRQELIFIDELLGRPDSGGVVIAGPAGVGKTRLAAEVSEQAAASGIPTAWAAATRAAASIPLGAFAHLLPPSDDARIQPFELLRRARETIAARAKGGRVLLVVDDAHLLDAASATLVQQVAATKSAFLVVTIRTGEPEPDPIVGLWKDRLTEYVELQALSREEVGQLVVDALGGDVDEATLMRMWDATRGNVLYLRELVAGGLEDGRLSETDGVWQWRGTLGGIARLTELIERRLGDLEHDERGLLEVIAIGEPLGVLGLDTSVSFAAVDELQRRGIVDVSYDGRRLQAKLAHPLYGEAVRARTSALRTRAVKQLLADMVERAGARRRDDVLRLASWRLDSGGSAAAELLVTAAQRARAGFDAALAERLARAAVDAGGGFAAQRALASALHDQGRFDEAEDILRRLADEAPTENERVAVTEPRVWNLLYADPTRGGSIEEADAVVERLAHEIRDPDSADRVAALRAALMYAAGRFLEAGEAAVAVLARREISDDTAVLAASTAVSCLTQVGRCDEALSVIDRWRDAAVRLADEAGSDDRFEYNRVLALLVRGDLVEAQTVAEERYGAAVRARTHEGQATWALARGKVALVQGNIVGALRWLKESARLLRAFDPHTGLPSVLPALAQAAAETNDSAFADAVLAEYDTTWPDDPRRPGVAIGIARAWTAAAKGELSRARLHAAAAAEAAVASGRLGLAYVAFHDLARLGDPTTASRSLAEIIPSVDGPLAPICQEHVEALVAHDPERLQNAATGFAALGANLLAAEAASQAAAAYRAVGRSVAARVSAVRAQMLAAKCPLARTPALTLEPVEDLTAREQEIASLAARGHSSRQIAERLVVSVRTVDNHLQHVYRKLGVSSRSELWRLLVGPEDEQPAAARLRR